MSTFLYFMLHGCRESFTMPLSRIKVDALEKEVHVIPGGKQVETVSGSVLAAPGAPPTYTRFRNKMSWWAIVYKSVPEAVGLAGIKYAFNPGEVRWRRYVGCYYSS